MLAILALALPLQAHEPEPCEQVRTTRRYAVAAGLDTRTLDVLEARLCADAPAPLSPLSADRCRDLDMMTRLIEISGSKSLSDENRSEVARARDLACGGVLEDIPTWSTGVTARAGNGSWSYPNAVTAKGVDGTWRYPDAITARAADGTWRYPDAVPARSAADRWSRPDGIAVGSADALLLWACQSKPEACVDLRRQREALDPHRAEAALVGAAWAAR